MPNPSIGARPPVHHSFALPAAQTAELARTIGRLKTASADPHCPYALHFLLNAEVERLRAILNAGVAETRSWRELAELIRPSFALTQSITSAMRTADAAQLKLLTRIKNQLIFGR